MFIGRGPKRAGVVAFVVALLAWPVTAAANTYGVPNTHDSGAGSLRKAITNANTHAGADKITINAIGTLDLQSSLPTITGPVTINGPGETQFTVSGSNLYRPLVNNAAPVSITGLEIADGRCINACGSVGGGIANYGTLTLKNASVTGNVARESGGTDPSALGGGIYNADMLSLIQTKLTGNLVQAASYTDQGNPYGGGVSNYGTLTVDRSTIDSNRAVATGGKFSNAVGGGIQNGGTLTISRSTVTRNVASGTGSATSNGAHGGGVSNTNSDSVHVTIDRSTIGANVSKVTSPGSSSGGGVEGYGATFAITSSTIASNSAGFYANLFDSAPVVLKNTIISNPVGGGTNCLGSGATSHGFNLASDDSCKLNKASDQPGTNPMLDALAANGGPTRTYGLKAGSPAIDQGLSSMGETTDQRGQTRPVNLPSIPNAPGGNGTDVGAFEVQAP